MKKILPLVLFCIPILLSAQEVANYFEPLKFRNIGPLRGGRSTGSSGVVGDPFTYYMGTTGGGLWKTDDAGTSWKNISDRYFKTGSVGAVAVSESHSYVVYVGMGEHAPRGVMTSYGDGVYKSTDAGKTWMHMGLEATQHIARVQIHPTNPDIVFVAAQGALYGPNPERGVFKSIDGGRSWRKVLFVNDSTGCSELSMDMNYPDILYAGMWQHQRTPWKVISGGDGSGVYKSVDGGETWKKIEKGLPAKKGKIGISVSRSNSDKVYAIVEGDTQKDKGGLFVSNNGGDSWNMVSGDNRLTQRAWYYTEVFADPNNENLVYALSAPALKSIDGGKSWQVMSGPHGDYHDLWINPNNSKNMVISDDGGAGITFNNGKSWSTQSTMPTAQFYRVTADNLTPYNLYGGQQDNSSIKIASQSFEYTINKQHWNESAGGESAFLAFDPDNPRYVMGGSYLGTIEIYDSETDAGTEIMASPFQYLGRTARDMEYLYNWNAPIIRSIHEENTFYHCAQLVLRTKDNGETWDEVSPDLTRNIDEKQGDGGGPLTNEAVGAENYGTISYIIESPHEKGVLITGSDDGQVYITKDNTVSWQNITPKNFGERLVNAIEISPHDPATIYIATTRYKFNDFTPGIFKSTDYGKSWKNVNQGIPAGAYTRVVREDKDRKGLLYAGTETGLYISWNGGNSWEPFQLNLPVTPINDLMIHQGDLLVATSGRSFWILDDLNTINQYESKGMNQFYKPNDALLASWWSPMNSSDLSRFKGTATYGGINPPNGVVLYYEVADSLDVKLEIYSGENLIRTITSDRDKSYKRYDGGPPSSPSLPKKKGLNRFVWDLRYPTMTGVDNVYIEANYRGHKVSPGIYTFKLMIGEDEFTQAAEVIQYHKFAIEEGQYKAYDTLMKEMEAKVFDMHTYVKLLASANSQLVGLLEKLDDELKADAKKLSEELTDWDNLMVNRKIKAYDDVENFKNKFTAEYLFLINATESTIPRVNKSNLERKKELDKQWVELEATAKTLLEVKLPEFNEKLWEAGVGAISLD